MNTEFNVIRFDYSAVLPLGNIQKSVELAFEEEVGFHDKAVEIVATFPALPEAESFAREQAAACALTFTGFDGDRAEWKYFYVQEVDEDGNFVDEHGGWGITVEDIRRSLTERDILLQNAIDFAESCTSEEDPDGLTVVGDPFFHNCRWMMKVEGINDSRYIGLNASGNVEFAEYYPPRSHAEVTNLATYRKDNQGGHQKMKGRIHIFCGYDPIPTSTHRPPVYEFTANTNTSCGGYGHGRSCWLPETAIVEVDLPEWVTTKHGALCRKGCFAKRTGTGDLALIVCANPATAKHTYIGECDHRALIMQALNGGLLMYYPTEDGKLACEPVKGEFVRWM